MYLVGRSLSPQDILWGLGDIKEGHSKLDHKIEVNGSFAYLVYAGDAGRLQVVRAVQ